MAVLAVVLYHAEVPWASGGFLGVDAFFVLSGFLITSLLLVERRNTGRIDLGHFWSRRARRLFPALVLVLGAVLLYALFLAEPAELDGIRSDGIATIFYFANWQFIFEGSSYFDLFVLESPLQHTWSLAIEEQWYLLWPLVLIVVLRRRPGARTVLWLSVALGLASAVWMAVLFESGADPSRVYYGTDTRAQSLLVGAALAAAVTSGGSLRGFTARHIAPALGLLAGAVLLGVWSLTPDSAEWLYGGGLLFLALCVAAVILVAVQPQASLVRSFLSWTPLRWLGIISYGVYLWHWPIFVVLSRKRAFLEDLTFTQLTLIRLGATLVVACASWFLVERPIRYGALGRRIRFAPALIPATAIVLTVLMISATSGASGADRLAASDRQLPTAESLREDGALGEADPAVKVLLVGDSVAASMASGFTSELQESERLLVWNQTILFCELARGERRANGDTVEPSNACEDWDEIWRSNAEEFAPDVAVLQVGAWEIFDRKVDGDWLEFGEDPYDEYFLDLLDEAIESLSSNGATVVILTTPHFDRSDSVSAREWTINQTWRTDHMNALFDEAAEQHPDAVLVDLGGYLCPEGDCIESLDDGTGIRDDGVHFTAKGAEAMAQWLAPQLRESANGDATSEGTSAN